MHDARGRTPQRNVSRLQQWLRKTRFDKHVPMILRGSEVLSCLMAVEGKLATSNSLRRVLRKAMNVPRSWCSRVCRRTTMSDGRIAYSFFGGNRPVPGATLWVDGEAASVPRSKAAITCSTSSCMSIGTLQVRIVAPDFMNAARFASSSFL